ncbi:MAG: oligopeptide transport system substrate-binding protein [Acidobacteriota bacterium]|jgi:ABC-type oligopeptide transport system substrate-binding subunit|nr:oligopeptide transport system substrate-binding protein [Acidobacteriota bacterium]
MSEIKTVRLFALILASALLAAGCAMQSKKSDFFGKIAPPDGQVLRYITGSEPESLDPQMSSGQPEARIDIALYEGLAEYHPKTMEPIPAIAERWTIDEDASEFVFFLRKNAKFSNGDPITAHDFVYTLRRGLRPELASRVAYLAWDIKYAEALNTGGAFVRDQKTGRFVLASETPKDAVEGGVAAEIQPASVTNAAPPDEETLHKKELGMKGEDAAPDTEFHHFIHAPERLVVPFDDKDREEAFKANPKLKDLVAGKELVPVKPEDIGVEAIDDYTLRITLRHPAPYFLGLVPHQFFRVIPEKVVEKYGVNWTKPDNIVTSGSFKLSEHKPYNQIVVVRNPFYWDNANVRLDKIMFFPLEDNTTMMNLYKAGEVDALYNHTVPASWLKGGIRYSKDYMDAPENASAYWQINVTKPPLDDKRVRKALNISIDRNALADYRVVSKANNTFVPQGILHGYPSPQGYNLNVEEARRLLAEAGYKDASGKFDPKKFPVDLVEITYNTNESNRQIAEFVQAQWKQNLGITIPLRNVEWKTFLNMRSKLEYKGIVGGAGWVGDYMDPYTYLGLFATREGDNGTGWYDTKFVAMLDEANREPVQAKRYQMMAKAEEYLLDAAPVIPLLKPATSWMKKPYVKGLYPNPGTLHAWKFVYIEHDQAKWDTKMPDMTTDEIAEKE